MPLVTAAEDVNLRGFYYVSFALMLHLCGLPVQALKSARTSKRTLVSDRKWPSLTAEGATTNGGHAIHSGRRWLERPLFDAPLPLVANNWPALDDPLPSIRARGNGRSRSQ